MSGGINFSGLSSGIDFDQIINALITTERSTMRRLETRKQEYETRNSALSGIESQLSELATAAEDIASKQGLLENETTSSDEDVLTATAEAAAAATQYSIVVNQLAVAEREVHAGVATKETQVGEGTFSYTYGTTTVSVETTADTTIEELVQLINNDAANPGVSASLLEYDAGGGQVYHLVLAGEDTGADNTIVIDDVNTTLDGTGGTIDFTSTTFQETRTARNAQLRLDGYPAGDWIERDSNSIGNLIDDVTLTLQGAGTVSLSITHDVEGLEEKINEFITQYNAVIDEVKSATSFDAETLAAGVLLGDYNMRFVRDTLSAIVTGAADGFHKDNDTFVLPAEIGIEIDGEGKLSLDSDAFDDAIDDNLQAVLSLFGANLEGESTSQHLAYYAASASLTTAGVYEVEADFTAGVLTAARIRADGETEWHDAEIDGSYIVGAEGYDEHELRIGATWDGASTTQTATVCVKQGFGAALDAKLDDLLDSLDGAMTVAQNYNTTVIEGIDDRIEIEDKRLETHEIRLRQRYARLETALMQMQQSQAVLGLAYS